jgi:3-dehydroquinate synthetase
LHGEAFSLGMRMSAAIASILEVCGQQRVDEHYEIIGACGLPDKYFITDKGERMLPATTVDDGVAESKIDKVYGCRHLFQTASCVH